IHRRGRRESQRFNGNWPAAQLPKIDFSLRTSASSAVNRFCFLLVYGCLYFEKENLCAYPAIYCE
ncbi:MAG: hypothetical protein KAT61_08170, partial [Gammaproteobacteria bacterium]|nr:hypothetical protein [Gammaproteobacteria bacterium]